MAEETYTYKVWCLLKREGPMQVETIALVMGRTRSQVEHSLMRLKDMGKLGRKPCKRDWRRFWYSAIGSMPRKDARGYSKGSAIGRAAGAQAMRDRAGKGKSRFGDCELAKCWTVCVSNSTEDADSDSIDPGQVRPEEIQAA